MISASTLKQYWFDIMSIAVVIIGSIGFSINEGYCDKLITSMFYYPDAPLGQRFPIAEQPFWKALYDYNTYNTYILLAVFLIFLAIGLKYKTKIGYVRRYALFGLTSVVLGPGLVVNGIFKALWGRPRPRATELWPNTDKILGPFFPFYVPVFLYLPAIVGKPEAMSFPTGHVSIIAVYMVFYYIFRDKKHWLGVLGNTQTNRMWLFAVKWLAVLIATAGSLLTGIARIAAGGHHASDVVWAYGMVYIVNAILYYKVFSIPQHELKLRQKLNIE